DRLGVDLESDLGRSRRRSNRQRLVIVRVWIVVERALGRPFLGPGLERRQFLERGQVVAARRRDQLLDRRRLRQREQQALGGRLVLAEAPGRPEVRQERREAPFRSRREAVPPALL